jgi:hypothetical protein
VSYEVRKAVMDRLSGDTTLMGDITGKVWDHALKREGNGATPGAFGPTTGDPTREPMLKPAIVIRGPNEVDAPDGPPGEPFSGEPELVNGFFTVHYYVPATENGKLLLDTVDSRVKSLLHAWQFTLGSGGCCTVTALERTDDIDSEEFRGNKEQQRRFVAEWIQE